jgi:hypothetical protein
VKNTGDTLKALANNEKDMKVDDCGSDEPARPKGSTVLAARGLGPKKFDKNNFSFGALRKHKALERNKVKGSKEKVSEDRSSEIEFQKFYNGKQTKMKKNRGDDTLTFRKKSVKKSKSRRACGV